MTLRTRLGLTILLTAVPLVAGLVWLRRAMECSAVEDRLREVAETYMDDQAREDYVRAPQVFGGRVGERRPGRRPPRGPHGEDPVGPPGGRHRPPPPPPRDGRAEKRGPRGPRRPHETWVWVYDSDYTSANRRAPAFPALIRAALEGGAASASAPLERDGKRGLQLAMFMSLNGGPPSVILVQRVGDEGNSAVPDMLWGAVILCGVLFLVVLFAAGPIVRRVRRLTAEVGESAASRYAQPVTARGNDEIAGLARAFNEAGSDVRGHIEDLAEREKTLRAFVSNTTHDVMIPLTVLQGYLSRMRKRLERGEAVDGELVVPALEEAHYMGSLVHNLSAVAKLEAGDFHIEFHPVDLNGVVERAVMRHRPMGDARDVAVDFAVPEAPVEIDGDVTLLEQAVSNLVHNAVRYNDAGGHVAVILARPAGGGFSLRVIDDGPGIPPDELVRLPERRFRGREARTRHPDGTGLGLDIARDVADRHGLTLDFRASEYGGLEAELRGEAAGG